MDPETAAIRPGFAAAAGRVDAVAGDGGLVLVPALLMAFPTLPPAIALGTTKLTVITETSVTAITYARRAGLDPYIALPAAGLAISLAGIGAAAASSLPADRFRSLIMALLIGVAAFVTPRPGPGSVIEDADVVSKRRKLTAVSLPGCGIGFHDGVFGPGTGTLLVMSFTGLLPMELLHSSAVAKAVNAGRDIGALTVFAVQGHILWPLGAGTAVCNIAGAALRARTALKRGSRFVRGVLLVVVGALVIKLADDRWG
ncbi:TSUP family transporter [Streptomyces pimonensis]|uniref:Probable membrane transporter protein n=1 Tax=Streptomyces pimonensis TaxID=2860288 RepID=A0ABV4IYC2_9ACTN